MTKTLSQIQKARNYAAQIKETLGWIELYFPAVATEMERVLNLGIPLADAISRGLISGLTDYGFDALIGSDSDLITARAVLEESPELANDLHAMWNEVFSRKHAI